jgi:hypothetical protein
MPSCPSCGQRKGRRTCPALGAVICTVCCGTKRLVEIACPETCVHLGTARSHPAAVVRRQQEKDVAAVLPTLQHLTERQHQLFFLFHTAIARHTPEGLARLLDIDVADAAAATAATLETAARGVIYEHTPQTLPAQRLAVELRTMLKEMRDAGATVSDREAALVLRAIEKGARGSAEPTAYLEVMARLLQVNRAARAAAAANQSTPSGGPPSSLIIP